MPATISLGQNYDQEYAAADGGLDQAETSGVGFTRHLALRSFDDGVPEPPSGALAAWGCGMGGWRSARVAPEWHDAAAPT